MVGLALWQWFQTTYNPMTGIFSNGISTTTKVQRMDIMHLDSAGTPDYQTSLFGVWPMSWKTAEFNYGTNEFHTIEVVFRYDFMDHTEPLDA